MILNKHFFGNLLFTLILLFIFQTDVIAQTNAKIWQYEWAPPKSFIENKGQFSNFYSSEKVLFAYDNGPTTIYFTKKGVRYSFLRRWYTPETAEERLQRRIRKYSAKTWKEREEQKLKMNIETDVVIYEWLNANPNVQVNGVDETPDYHNYDLRKKDGSTENVSFIKGYKKIVYKNIYPNIDIEFGFHKTDGIEYTVILHLGADISKFKMTYSKDFIIDNEGNIRINTKFGDIIEYAPHAFYADNKNDVIKSEFIKNGNTISFKHGAYDPTKEVIIDPWIQTPSLPNSNGVWECERDAAGNVYIIGGDMPMKLQKYDTTGILQWTYNTPWDTASYWLGTLATDLQGNSFITAGSVGNLKKITTTNTVAWSAGSTTGGADEYWGIAFNCDQSKLIIGGTTGNMTQLEGAIFSANANNGTITDSVIVGWGNMYGLPPSINEVRSITSSPNGRYYFLTLDTIGCLGECSSSQSILFRENSIYNLAYKCENYRPNNGNAGIKAIKAGRNFLYTQNGTHLHKRSLLTVNILDSVAIPGGISVTSLGQKQVGNSGIDIDSCGNVYVGSGNCVVKYDANLIFIDSVNLPFRVFDVAVSDNGSVIICGATGSNSSTNRIGFIQSVNLSACSPMLQNCSFTGICPAGPFCLDSPPTTLSVDTFGGTWHGSGIDSLTGVFSPATAGLGIHTIAYNLPTISDSILITVDSCFTLNVCSELNGNISVSGGTAPYTWQKIATSTSPITNLFECVACGYSWNALLNQCVNGMTPVTSCINSYWSTFATGSNVIPPGTYPLRVLDISGGAAIINSFNSLPSCTTCTQFDVILTNISNALCIGGSDGHFTATACGGTPPYNYTLMLDSDTVATYNYINGNQIFAGLQAGNYVLYFSDYASTLDSTTVTIGENVFTVSATSNSPVCAGHTINFNAGGGSVYSWAGPNGFTSNVPNPFIYNATSTNSGTYYVTISSPPCSVIISVNVVVNPKPVTPNIYFNQPCLSGILQLSANLITGATYYWSGPAGFVSTQQNPVITNFSQVNTGIYSLYVKNPYGCNSDTVSGMVSWNGATVVNLGSDLIFCNNETVILNAGSSFNSYLWNTSDTTQTIAVSGSVWGIGTHPFSITVTDTNGCVGKDTILVTFQDCSGIDELTSKDLKVYPNPADNSVHIILPNDFTANTIIQMFDITGKLVINENVIDKSITINIKQLSEGLYYIKVTNKGTSLVRELLVK